MEKGLQAEISVTSYDIDMSNGESVPSPAMGSSGEGNSKKRRTIIDEENLLAEVEECKLEKNGKGFEKLIKTIRRTIYEPSELIIVDKWLMRLLTLYKEAGSSISDVKYVCKKCIRWATQNCRTSLRQVLELNLMECFYKLGDFQAALQLGEVLQNELPTDFAKDLLIQVFLYESKIHLALKDSPRAITALKNAQDEAIQAYCPPSIQERLKLQAGLVYAKNDNDVRMIRNNARARGRRCSATIVIDLEDEKSFTKPNIQHSLEDLNATTGYEESRLSVGNTDTSSQENAELRTNVIPLENQEDDFSMDKDDVIGSTKDEPSITAMVREDMEEDASIPARNSNSPNDTRSYEDELHSSSILNSENHCQIEASNGEKDEEVNTSTENQKQDCSITASTNNERDEVDTSIQNQKKDCPITAPTDDNREEVETSIQSHNEDSPITVPNDDETSIPNPKKDCSMPTPNDKSEDVDTSIQKRKTDFPIREPSSDEEFDVSIRNKKDFPTTVPNVDQEEEVCQTIPSTPNSTEVDVDSSITPISLSNCPKLKLRTTVPIQRLAAQKLEKLKQSSGRITLSEFDLLSLAVSKLGKYNPTMNERNDNAPRKRSGCTTSTGDKEPDDSDNTPLLSDDSEDENMTKILANQQRSKTFITVVDDTKNLSDMEDMTTVSEESQVEAEDENRPRKHRSATVGANKRYITPYTKNDLSSDDRTSKIKRKRKEEKVKREKVDEESDDQREKLSDGTTSSKKIGESMGKIRLKSLEFLISDDDEIDDLDVKKEKKVKKSNSPDTDSDFTGYRKLLNKKKKKEVSKRLEKIRAAILDDSSDDSDFAPLSKKVFGSNLSGKKDKKASTTEESAKQGSQDSCSDSDVSLRRTLRSHKKRALTASDSDLNSKKLKKKRRRVIKAETLTDESDDSDVRILDSDVEIKEASTKKKSIRKVMGKNELLKTTRQAAKEEDERKKRVADKQKLFNQVFTVETNNGTPGVTEIVLDFDKETKTPLLSVDPTIVKCLKPHQVEGIKFMWDTCYESLKKIGNSKGGGCILAHCMGLGKTLQAIGFLHTVMSSKACDTRRALVICPLNTVGNWYNEFRQWCSDCDVTLSIHRLWDVKGKHRYEALESWNRLGGVGIIHYDSFRTLANSDEKKKGRPTQKELKIIETCLLNPGPDIVICDEGHLLKNAKAQQAKAVMKISTQRRVVLTGTPLQNNLVEYHTMMSFVKPNLLGTKKEFMNRFVNPIAHGQHKDSGEQDVRLMKRRAHVLHKLLDGCVQRLDYSVLTPYLPPKFEYAISINLSKTQKDLYSYFLNNLTSNAVGKTFQSSQLFKDYQALVKVWTHPVVLTFKARKELDVTSDTGASLRDFIDDDTSDEEEDGSTDSEGNKVVASTRKTRSSKSTVEEKATSPPPLPSESSAWYSSFFKSNEDMEKMELSGKMIILFEILKICEEIGDKVLVFSQFLTSLDLIEDFLADKDAETKKDSTHEPVFPPTASSSVGRWRPNIEYFRIDGSTRSYDRQKSCDIFNKSKATRAKLFLISTKAGGLGINLTGANRVVIFDASWNPSHDLQSIFRVFRFGQLKPCYVYRLLARGTMEEKIYNRQVVKLSLSCRVVDEQQIERHFQFDEIQDMYKFNSSDDTERPIPIVPKDRLLAELLISHKEWVFSYLEHDSLLENKEEEELTEAERKAAWEEYENEDRQQNKPNVLFDDWTKFIMEKLRLRFPLKGEAEIYRLSQWTRSEIESMRLVYSQLNSTANLADQTALQQSLRAKISMLKHVYGDDVDWNGVWKAHIDAKKAREEQAVLSAALERPVVDLVKQKLQQSQMTTTPNFTGNYPMPSTSRTSQSLLTGGRKQPPLTIPRIMQQKSQGAFLQNQARPLAAMKYPVMENLSRFSNGSEAFVHPSPRQNNTVDEFIIPDIVDLE